MDRRLSLSSVRTIRTLFTPAPTLEVVRQARDIAGKPISLRIENAGEIDAAGILPEMIVERADPAIGRQRGKEIDLRRDHAIGTRDQVVIDLEVDEAEQDRDKDREQGRQCGSPVKRVRAYELHLMLRTLRHPVTSPAPRRGRAARAPKKLDLSI